jgi:hypothetical protein
MDQLLSKAQSGRREDVRSLVRALPDWTFIVPGVRTEANGMSGPELIQDFQELQSSSRPSFQPRVLEDERDRPFLPVYTTRDRYEQQTESSGDDDLEAITMDGEETFAMAQDLCERDVIRGMVVNLFHDTELRLNVDEIGEIAGGTPVPLKDHLRGHEVSEDQITDLPPPSDLELPDALVDVISAYVEADGKLTGYECVWGRNPAVDRRPHLILNLHTDDQQLDREERARELHMALADQVPDPGFIEVTFNRSFDRVLRQG